MSWDATLPLATLGSGSSPWSWLSSAFASTASFLSPSQGVVDLVATTLMHSLWQGVVIAVLLKLALHRLRSRRATAQSRYATACVALGLLALAPVLTYRHLESEARAVPVVDQPWPLAETRLWRDGGQTIPTAALNLDEAEAELRELTQVRKTAKSRTGSLADLWRGDWGWKEWTVFAWCAGMLLCSLRHLVAWTRLQHLRRHGLTPASAAMVATVQRLQEVMGFTRKVTVQFSDRVAGPVALGCFRLLILVPVSLATRLPLAQWEMILAHELAHLRRHDYLINLLQAAVETLLFYHPAVWWINAQIRKEREHACDDVAVRATRDPGGYARALVQLAELQHDPGTVPAPGLALAATRRPGNLRQRIERLLAPESTSPVALRGLPGLTVFLLMLATLASPTLPQKSLAQAVPDSGDQPPKRGEIRDRQGVVVAVDDRPDRQIVFRLPAVVEAWQKAHGPTLPMEEFETTNAGKEKVKGKRVNITAIFHEIAAMPLQEAGLGGVFNASSVRAYYGLRPQDQADGFVFRSELNAEDFTKAQALAATGSVPGLQVRTRYLRRYPYAALAGHVLGYVKAPAPVYTRAPGTHVPYCQGASGAEKAWNRELMPTDEVEDGKGVSLGESKGGDRAQARAGSNVQLTLDLRHQYIVERTLRDAGVGRAAAVLMEVNTGDVLAMASLPNYDPNHFIPGISQAQYERYRDDATLPLVNRAVRGYVPASTFNAVTGLAAVMSGKSDAEHECNGALVVGSRTFNCWIGMKNSTHGRQTLDKALGHACGPYFYELVLDMGFEKVEQTAALLGLGQRSGIGLWEESSGTIPGPAWVARERLAKKKPSVDRWTDGQSCNTAIGQGMTEATPLQMTNVFASLANGGTVWRPRLLDGIADADSGEEKVTPQPRVRAANLKEHGLTEAGLKRLTDGFEKRAELVGLSTETLDIAGLTGTAQNWRLDAASGNMVTDNNALIVCYAPADKPRWALTVLVQNGRSGGSTVGPLVKRILDQVAAVEQGTLKVDVVPMMPAKGHFLEPGKDIDAN